MMLSARLRTGMSMSMNDICPALSLAIPGAVFGLAAIGCWALMFLAFLAVPAALARKYSRRAATLAAFLLGGLAAGAAVFMACRPQGFSLGEALRASVDAETYGHAIEHAAENAICLSSFACVLGGALCAGVVLAVTRLIKKPKPA
jgi:hypothetical protein